MALNDSQKWLLLAGVAGLGVLIYLLKPVLAPFAASALLAYLGDPLADRLEKWRLSRTAAVVVVFIGILTILTLVILLLIPMLEQQIRYLLVNLPRYIDRIQHDLIPRIVEWLQLDPQLFDLNTLKQQLQENWKQAGSFAVKVFSSISSSGMTLLLWISNLVLIPVVTFYLLRDWDVLVARARELLPRSIEPVAVKLAAESDEVLAAFLRGQLTVMIALGTVYSIGLWLAGLNLALLIGMLAGLVSFVPYLGFIVGIVAASVAMLLQTQDLMHLIPVIIVFGVGQMLEGMVLTPLLVGDRIGLHPVAVIFAVLAGGQLFGFIGVLLALPAAAVIAVILRHAHERYLHSQLYEDR